MRPLCSTLPATSGRSMPSAAASTRSSQALVDSKDFAELVDKPAGLAATKPARRSPRSRRSSASTRSPPISSACSPATAARAQLRAVIRAFRRLAAEHRGETTAEVVTARPLNDDQIAALKAQLRARAGRDVAIDAQVDPDILGGIVVKLGSQQIDASIRTKLNRLASAMKG